MNPSLATSPLDAVRVDAAADPLLHALGQVQAIERVGRVSEAYGTLIKATGLRAAIGELCHLRNPGDTGPDRFELAAEVVGVARQHTLLTPLGPLDGIAAVSYTHLTLPTKRIV